MEINDIKTGQTFTVEENFEDEWFYRGIWLKTNKESTAVNLSQGCNNVGELKKFRTDIPLKYHNKKFDLRY